MSVNPLIPFVDLKTQYQGMRRDMEEAVHRVLDSGWFVQGEEVESFEEEFARYVGARHAVGVNSGTSALHLALLAAGVGPGSEVITVPFTFIATVATILYTGAQPVLVDIDPQSFTMSPQRVAEAITERTRAIVPVHLYGQPADLDPVLELAQDRGITVIEDAAQAHGAEYKNRRLGGLGAMGCFSFYPSKNLGAYGEGGAVTTNDPSYDRHLRLLRDWGQDRKYSHRLQGYNYRMESLQGAILKVKLARLESWIESRQTHARRYDELLAGVGVETPKVMPYSRHVYHLYSVRHRERDLLQQSLRKSGIETGIHYPIPVHLQEAHRDLGYVEGDFPHSERAAREVLSLPMYPELDEGQIETISRRLSEAIEDR